MDYSETFKNHFIESMEEINKGEFNILSNLTNELANQFINKILSLLITEYQRDNNDILETPDILSIVKYLDYDNNNNALLINALKKGLKILNSYNIDGYYLMYYEGHNEEHQISYSSELDYHVIDHAGINRTIGFDVYSLSRIHFKTTRNDLVNLDRYLKNKQRNLINQKLKSQIIS